MTQDTPAALAKLRHLHANLVNGAVRDTASAKRIAEGLLSPAIQELERAQVATSAAGGATPTAGELVQLAAMNDLGYVQGDRYGERLLNGLQDDADMTEATVAFARAVLNRWGVAALAAQSPAVPDDATTCELARHQPTLYHAMNTILAHIGHSGAIDLNHQAVQDGMAALHAIDGGTYQPDLASPDSGAGPDSSLADTWEHSAADAESQRSGVGERLYTEGLAEGMRICARDLRAALAQQEAQNG